jgi:hypothetical protein
MGRGIGVTTGKDLPLSLALNNLAVTLTLTFTNMGGIDVSVANWPLALHWRLSMTLP